MIEEEIRVGPKGQVVIPHTMRKAIKINPGSKIIFKMDGEKLTIEKPEFDAVGIFSKISKQITYNKRIDPHTYEEQIEQRTQK